MMLMYYRDIDFDLSSIQIVYRAYLLYYIRHGNTKFNTRIQIGVLEWCMLFEGTVTLTSSLSFLKRDIVRPANRNWACQSERCHSLSNKTSLQ